MSTKLREIEDYFRSPNISQSFLKLFLKDQPRSLFRAKEKELYYEEKSHFIKGSLIDFFITTPEEDINEIYYLDNYLNKPSSAIMSIINQIYDEDREFDQKNIVEIARLSAASKRSYFI